MLLNKLANSTSSMERNKKNPREGNFLARIFCLFDCSIIQRGA